VGDIFGLVIAFTFFEVRAILWWGDSFAYGKTGIMAV
jgi:hypothetical protein